MMPPAGMPPEGAPEMGGLSQEEMRANLSGLMGKIDESYRDLNGQRFISDNDNAEQKQAIIKQALAMLQRYGVDFNNPESVTKFLDKLYKSNPDAYELFEAAFSALLGGDADTGDMNTLPDDADLPPAIGEGVEAPADVF